MELKRQLGIITAVLVIIADCIGTGIFVTTNSALCITGHAGVVMALWILGGLAAITGSLCYGELATMWPDDGGEYVYLKRIYGLLPSFLTGWISLMVGFTASAAISTMTLIMYLNAYWPGTFLAGIWHQKLVASGIIIFLGMIHIIGVRSGSFIQNVLTFLKLAIVLAFIGCGFWMLSSRPDLDLGRLVMSYDNAAKCSPLQYGFALMIIMFAYSGWNGATYIAGEIKNPERNLPRAMFWGAILVTVVYVLLNAVFLLSAPGTELMGNEAIGVVSARKLFGDGGARIVTLVIAFILLSCVSVQLMIGPRVSYAMARDRMIFHSLERINPRTGTPDLAIAIHIAIAVIYVFVGRDSIGSLLGYMGFALGIFPLLTVIGMVIARYRHPELARPFRVRFFPVVPFIYIGVTVIMMATSLVTWTGTSLFALGIVGLGVLVFYVWQWIVRKNGGAAAGDN